MDTLADLPTNDGSASTPEEINVMNKLFPTDQNKSQKTGWMKALKLALYTTVIFFVLANPWSRILLDRLPYADSDIAMEAIKSVIFFVIFFVFYKFFF